MEEQKDVEFTPEELALLTPFNGIAYDLMCVKFKAEGTVSPVWLVLSDEARDEARAAAFGYLRARPEFMYASDITIESYVNNIKSPVVDLWRKQELMLKQSRGEGNPLAWFTPR